MRALPKGSAVLAASSEPLAEGEVARLGHLAATVELPAAIARPAAVPSARRLSPWRWLAPAAGVAAVLALWLAFHPGRSGEPTTLTAEKIEPANNPPPPVIVPEAPSAANAPPAAAARDEAPASNNSNSPAPEQRALREEKSKPEEESKPEEKSKTVEPIPPAELQDRAASAPQNAASALPEPAAKQTSPPSAAQKAAEAAPRAPAAEADGAVATATPPATAAAPVQPPNGGVAPKAQSDIRALSVRAQKQPADALASAGMAMFAAPDGAVSWRVGAAGRLERSADQGRTWQPQASGVTADLLAGAAVSDGVAWAVGRGGAILRTADGEHWQRVALPRDVAAGSPPDWTGVDARDALHATITSKDLRRFVTADGGRTWTAQ